MSLTHRELTAHAASAMALALNQIVIAEKMQVAAKSMVALMAKNYFWLKRTPEDIAAVWDGLRQDEVLFNTVLRAYNIFRLSYELDSGDTLSHLLGRIAQQMVELSFTDSRHRSVVDDNYKERVAPSEVDYKALLAANGWFGFLLILELTGWGLKISPATEDPDTTQGA